MNKATAQAFIDQAHGELDRANFRMRTEWFMGHQCDETSLLFGKQSELTEFLAAARALGLEHFNSVPSDVMVRQDQFGQEFLVRFEFLRVPGTTWRIEAMCVLGGTAPLHEVALAQHGSGTVIHVSHKLPSRDAYDDAKWMHAHAAPAHNAYGAKAEYMNSYGQFAYFAFPDSPYVKPRINTRDAVAS